MRAELTQRAGPGAEAAWVAEAVRERLSTLAAWGAIKARGSLGSREAFERVLAKSAAAPPPPGDEW